MSPKISAQYKRLFYPVECSPEEKGRFLVGNYLISVSDLNEIIDEFYFYACINKKYKPTKLKSVISPLQLLKTLYFRGKVFKYSFIFIVEINLNLRIFYPKITRNKH